MDKVEIFKFFIEQNLDSVIFCTNFANANRK